MKSQTVLKWRNKFSGEEGFVMKVSKASGCFFNTFDAKEAKGYRSQAEIEKDLLILQDIGEMVNNEFYIANRRG